MQKTFLLTLLIFQIFSSSVTEEDDAILQISRSKSHYDQTGALTPLIVTLSSKDVKEKVRGVDLICVVDASGSMRYNNKMNLVKQSLIKIVNLMNSQDKLAIVTFTDTSQIPFKLTQMTDSNKITAINAINKINAYGYTNIYAGMVAALGLITENYSSGNRVCSIILLSDGYDGYANADTKLRSYINRYKANYVFTMHTLGYGDSHNADLMNKISLIRDGGYFFVRYLSMVKDAILEIYGFLSTNYKVNVEITISSKYRINDVKGREDMYQSSLTTRNPYTFKTKLIHFVYGKRYDFITLVNIPSNTLKGEIVLTAKVIPFNKQVNYLWDNILDPFAYEEYIRGISFTYFQNAYNRGPSKGISIMNTALTWINSNYDGIRDWKKEYTGIREDLRNFKSYGQANILSKLRELKSSKLGIHYNDENSYQRNIIDGSYRIDIKNWNSKIIT